MHSCTHALMHSCTHALIHSFTHSLIHSGVRATRSAQHKSARNKTLQLCVCAAALVFRVRCGRVGQDFCAHSLLRRASVRYVRVTASPISCSYLRTYFFAFLDTDTSSVDFSVSLNDTVSEWHYSIAVLPVGHGVFVRLKGYGTVSTYCRRAQ